MDRIVDGADRRAYYTETPNIVFTLGLSPYELSLYVHLKRTAGEKGGCWKKTETLAAETKMSAGMVSQAKAELCKPRPELNGKALIRIEEEKRREGGKPNHIITITDIWPENMVKFGAPTISPDELATSHNEIASSPHEQAISHDEIKKNPGEEKPSEGSEERARANILPAWLDPRVWARWVAHRAEIGHPITLQQAQAQFRKLEQFRARGMPPNQIIEESIAHGWQGLFELKEQKNVNGNGREKHGGGPHDGPRPNPRPDQAPPGGWKFKNSVAR